MQRLRRRFLKQLAGGISLVIGGTQLAGCLGEGDSSATSVSQQAAGPEAATPGEASVMPSPSAPPDSMLPTQTAQNSAPVWQPSPTIEFIEGVPAIVSVRQFVQDPDQDPLIIQLKSGTLLPGITWNPGNATIQYDGRPLGAKQDQPVVLNGVVFSADDSKN